MTFSAQASDPTPIIRLLTAADADAYRALRQRILAIGDGCYFSDSYTREQQLVTQTAWQKWCSETPDHCIFGTFIGNELVGVMMITCYQALGDRTVEWEAIWLDPRFRKQGIAKQAYQHVRQWTVDRGYDRVVLFIRSDNLRSLYIHQKLGARYISTKRSEIWADGSTGDVHVFLLDLKKSGFSASQHRATMRLEKTIRALADNQLAGSQQEKQLPASAIGSFDLAVGV